MKKSLFFVLCLTLLASGRAFADVGDTLSYYSNVTSVTSIGVNNTTSTIYWGVMFPSSMLSGRDSVRGVLLYMTHYDSATYSKTYTATIYQGGTTSPQTQLYSQTYTVSPTQTGGFVYFAFTNPVAIVDNQNLWVIFSNTDERYPASAYAYMGNPNSNWLSLDGSNWSHAGSEVGLSSDFSWLIACVTHTSSSAAPVVIASGPTTGAVGQQLTFTASASTGANISWQISQGTPSTATGATATASWSNPGTYNVIATATNSNGTARDTVRVSIFDCAEITSFPYVMGFEPTDPVACWTFVDADGDGYTWDPEVFSTSQQSHSGSGCVSSASYINGPGALSPDNWLISPQIYLPHGNGFTMSWYVGALDQNYYAEHYGVYISTTGTNPSDFTLLQQYDLTSVNWTLQTINLDSYAGQHVYIAFRHFDITDMYWMKIDDFTITMQQPSTYNVSFVCEGGMVGKVDTLPSGNNPSLCGQQVNMSSEHTTNIYITCQKFEYNLEALYVNDVNRMSEVQLNSGDVQDVYVFHFQPQEASIIRAVFVGREMTVTVIANPPQGGTVTGGGTYHYMDTATLQAIPNSGYTFTGWHDGNTSNPRQVVVTSNTTYSANFAATQSIDEVADAAIKLSPNPATDYVTLSLAGVSGEVSVAVIDINGKNVFTQSGVSVSDNGASLKLDVSSLPAGSYFVRIGGNGFNTVKKFIKR